MNWLKQVLSAMYDRNFSAYSYGFRPNKGAQQAISQGLININSGYQDIIDLDLIPTMDFVVFKK